MLAADTAPLAIGSRRSPHSSIARDRPEGVDRDECSTYAFIISFSHRRAIATDQVQVRVAPKPETLDKGLLGHRRTGNHVGAASSGLQIRYAFGGLPVAPLFPNGVAPNFLTSASDG
jgi:hypothetical protein